MRQIGLIAGSGEISLLLGREIVREGREPVVIDLTEGPKKVWEGISRKIFHLEVGQVGKIIDLLHREEISKIVMAGKVPKALLFKGLELDKKARNILVNLKERSDEAIMLGIIAELEKEGIKVAKQRDYLRHLFPEQGLLTETAPDELQSLDIEYGMRLARAIAKLNIGQMVVVKNQTVLAVEAIEGTDETILRGGKLGGQDVVVAKVSKPDQDPRFDIPTVGLATIETMRKVKAKVLSIEAGKVFLVNKEEVIQRANEYGIVIFCKKVFDKPKRL